MRHPFSTDAASVAGSVLSEPDLLSGACWNEFRTFLVVAKGGSVTRAAERLTMSRMTVTRHIRRLEDVIGGQLLVSNAAGVRLTDRGVQLARALARVDQDLFALTRDVGVQPSKVEGVVRVSCADGLGLVFVTPALKAFSESYPGVKIHLKSLLNYRSLRENTADCVVAFSPEEHRDFTSVRLGWLHLVPVVARGYVDAHGAPSADNLEAHDFLDSEKYAAAGGIWDPWHVATRRGQVRHFADASVAYAMMVRAGLGIGLLASYTLQEPTVVHADIGVRITLPIYAVFLTDRLRAKPVAVVRDFLVATLGEHRHWFQREPQLVPPPDYDDGFKLLFAL